MKSNSFVLILISAYLIIGGIGMFLYISKLERERKKTLLTKYFVEVIVIYLILCSLMFMPFLFLLIAPMIIAAGFWEIEKIAKPKWLVLIGYTFIAGSFIGFMQFVIKDPVIGMLLYILIFTFDMFSQIAGQLLGGPKLIPTIISGKTLSGFLSGFIIAFATAFILMEFSAVLFFKALIIILSGFAGDVLASYLKGKSGAKDFNDLLPAHFNSFIVAGAVLFWIEILSSKL